MTSEDSIVVGPGLVSFRVSENPRMRWLIRKDEYNESKWILQEATASWDGRGNPSIEWRDVPIVNE